ncbi:MAG: hypothetical protein K9M98_07015 [Cephaloticoccus sp.]|nr:hypothetical protein [Cephaloticoccus sp.]MCF7760239.1 hypothetical protein [Cephaloticoccus sp.]
MSEIGYLASSTALPKIILPEATGQKDQILAALLRRCSPETLAAARRFRCVRAASDVPVIVRGVITRYVDADKRMLLSGSSEGLRLREDLALDSLSLIEVAMTLEEVMEITLNDDKLRQLQTLGDVNRHTRECLGA